MELLLEFYVNLKLLAGSHVFSLDAERDLEEYFLKPFMRFIEKLDKDFGGTYFADGINKLLTDKTVNVTLKVVNIFGFPIQNIEVKVSYVRFPEFGKYARAYPLCTLKTNEMGIVNIRLLRPREGNYRVDIGEYGKVMFLDAKANNYVKIRVLSFFKKKA